MRVAGTDPGTSSLDIVVLDDGQVHTERRWLPSELRADTSSVARFLESCGPLDLVAAPSGYGLPLVRVADLDPLQERLISFVRPDDIERARGVEGLMKTLRSLKHSSIPAVVLPGGIHLPTILAHRKTNRIDLGTPDKVCVAALALFQASCDLDGSLEQVNVLVVEIGSAFSGLLILAEGKIVDARSGSFGPIGLGGAGALDGEFAYAASPLSKDDLFAGGVGHQWQADSVIRLRESLIQQAAALTALTKVDRVVLQAHGVTDEAVRQQIERDLEQFAPVSPLRELPGATLKHAAQGAAIIADGLAGGRFRELVAHLKIERASGSILDHLDHPASARIRALFQNKDAEL